MAWTLIKNDLFIPSFDQIIFTDETVITIDNDNTIECKKIEKITSLIDVAFPQSTNFNQKYTEKCSK